MPRSSSRQTPAAPPPAESAGEVRGQDPPATPPLEERPPCHTRGPGIDPVALNEVKLQFLQDQAQRADSRITELNQELLMHRGGGQHLGHVIGLIEAHRARLGEHGKEQEAAGSPLTGQPLAEHLAQLAGVVDALALLRSQAKSAELSAQRAEAALQEMSRHRSDLSLQGRAQAGKVGQLMAELAAGTPREMAGRPPTAEAVRARVEAGRVAPEKAAETTIVGKRKSIKLG